MHELLIERNNNIAVVLFVCCLVLKAYAYHEFIIFIRSIVEGNYKVVKFLHLCIFISLTWDYRKMCVARLEGRKFYVSRFFAAHVFRPLLLRPRKKIDFKWSLSLLY